MNASEERLVSEYCTVFFYLSLLLRLFCIINTLHVGVDYLIIFIMPNMGGGGGLKMFLEGWTFCLGGGGVIANIGGSTPLHPTKSVYGSPTLEEALSLVLEEPIVPVAPCSGAPAIHL